MQSGSQSAESKNQNQKLTMSSSRHSMDTWQWLQFDHMVSQALPSIAQWDAVKQMKGFERKIQKKLILRRFIGELPWHFFFFLFAVVDFSTTLAEIRVYRRCVVWTHVVQLKQAVWILDSSQLLIDSENFEKSWKRASNWVQLGKWLFSTMLNIYANSIIPKLYLVQKRPGNMIKRGEKRPMRLKFMILE